MATAEQKPIRTDYTKTEIKNLKAHSRAKTPVAKISKMVKRSEGSLRAKAHTLSPSARRLYASMLERKPLPFR